MTSIIKVDTIQTAAGGTPTASSLGIGGTIGQVFIQIYNYTSRYNIFNLCYTNLTEQ
jgi:hypothetical protein